MLNFRIEIFPSGNLNIWRLDDLSINKDSCLFLLLKTFPVKGASSEIMSLLFHDLVNILIFFCVMKMANSSVNWNVRLRSVKQSSVWIRIINQLGKFLLLPKFRWKSSTFKHQTPHHPLLIPATLLVLLSQSEKRNKIFRKATFVWGKVKLVCSVH